MREGNSGFSFFSDRRGRSLTNRDPVSIGEKTWARTANAISILGSTPPVFFARRRRRRRKEGLEFRPPTEKRRGRSQKGIRPPTEEEVGENPFSYSSDLFFHPRPSPHIFPRTKKHEGKIFCRVQAKRGATVVGLWSASP